MSTSVPEQEPEERAGGPDDSGTAEFGRSVGRGLGWGFLNSLVIRVANLVLGIVLARLLSPAQFGVFAIALTALSVLLTLADLGMSADLVRTPDPRRMAPTTTSLSVLIGGTITLLMVIFAEPLASALGSAEAAPVIRLLSVTVVLASVGVAPYASLLRGFGQRRLFAIEVTSFVVSTALTVGLVLAGAGVMALAWGRVAGQCTTTLLQFAVTRSRPRFGYDRSVARAVVGFGLPLAAANMLSWAILNVDYVVIGRLAGATALGFYVLAFNISSWPTTAVGQVIRSVALAGFARVDRESLIDALRAGLGLASALGLLFAVGLGTLAAAVVRVLYGQQWLAAAPALVVLAALGAMRVVFDVFASFLVARGASRQVLAVQVLWILALIPTMILAVGRGGFVAAGVAHLVVGALIVTPSYLYAISRQGIPPRRVLGVMIPPLLAAVPTAVAIVGIDRLVGPEWLSLVAGAITGLAVFGMLLQRWFRAELAQARLIAQAGVAS